MPNRPCRDVFFHGGIHGCVLPANHPKDQKHDCGDWCETCERLRAGGFEDLKGRIDAIGKRG